MKVLLVNPSDCKGGAAKVALTLGRGLRDRGHEVCYLVGKKHLPDGFIEIIEDSAPERSSLVRRIGHRLGVDAAHFDAAFPRRNGRSFFEQFDLIHLHDLPPFNLAQLPWLTRIRPVVWTLHTMLPMTGGCLYSFDCRRWLSRCGRCPQFGRFPLNWLHRDGSFLLLAARRTAYRFSRMQLVGVSDWISTQARRGIMKRFPVQTILNPVDCERFYPMDPDQARRALGIPPKVRTLLFSIAANPNDHRKGLQTIREALPRLRTRGIFLLPLTIASASNAYREALAGCAGIPPRHVSDTDLLNQYYNAADVVWHPSLADTSSLVILESFATGTPVIAAEVGGPAEIVRAGEGGILFEAGDGKALAEATDDLLSAEARRRRMGAAARRYVESRYAPDRFVDEHEALYQRAMAHF